MTDLRTPVPFGQTGLQVCRLGIGSSFTRDPAIIEEAVDQGVNYLYWGSIRRPAFGRAIKNVARRNREGVVLTVQSYTRVAALLAPSIEVALRRAGVEYFDFLLLGKWDMPPPARDCYRFALSHPAANLVLCGPANREQMQEAMRALDGGPLEPDEMQRMQRIGDHVYGRYKPQFSERGDSS